MSRLNFWSTGLVATFVSSVVLLAGSPLSDVMTLGHTSILHKTKLVNAAFAQEMEFGEDEVETTAVAKKKKRRKNPPPDSKPPSKTLQRAIKLYSKNKDYNSASIEFAKVLAGKTKDSEANKQRAEFFMGKTLYEMGFYAGSLAYFDQIVETSTGHIYYNATLKWLAALSRVLPETSGILDKIGQYDPASLSQSIFDPVRDELYFLLGNHYYRQDDLGQAVSLFQKVKISSPFYVKAKFFEGVTYVREYKGKQAVDAFKDILVLAEEKSTAYTEADLTKYQQLAWLQLARVFYSTKQFDLSIKYYEYLSQSSPDWLDSLFEASWAYFMRVKYSKALGNIHTLNAPYFEDEFFPESILLKAVIYYKYCLYEQALESVEEYDQKYRPIRKDLKEILKKYDDNAEFFEYIKKVLKNKAGLPEEMQRLVLSVLGDKTLKKTFAWVDELNKELDMHEKEDSTWKTTKVANDVLTELTLQQSLAEGDAGKLARERLERLAEELKQLSRQGGKIRIETLQAQAGRITAKARGEQISSKNKQEPIVVDDEHFMWRFNGEYWKDELGFYRFKIRSQCAVAPK